MLRLYGILVRNRVEFDKSHMFNREKLEAEILPKYPEQRKNILAFIGGIKLSMRLATAMIAVITICGGVLMFWKS